MHVSVLNVEKTHTDTHRHTHTHSDTHTHRTTRHQEQLRNGWGTRAVASYGSEAKQHVARGLEGSEGNNIGIQVTEGLKSLGIWGATWGVSPSSLPE
eukprot:6456097-Amphidinium_carterae.1